MLRVRYGGGGLPGWVSRAGGAPRRGSAGSTPPPSERPAGTARGRRSAAPAAAATAARPAAGRPQGRSPSDGGCPAGGVAVPVRHLPRLGEDPVVVLSPEELTVHLDHRVLRIHHHHVLRARRYRIGHHTHLPDSKGSATRRGSPATLEPTTDHPRRPGGVLWITARLIRNPAPSPKSSTSRRHVERGGRHACPGSRSARP